MRSPTFSVSLAAASLCVTAIAQDPGFFDSSTALGDGAARASLSRAMAPAAGTDDWGGGSARPSSLMRSFGLSPLPQLDARGVLESRHLHIGDELRSRAADAIARQEPDYSLYGQFFQAHGDFMLRYKRFDPMVEVGGFVLPDASIQGEQGRFDQLNWFADAEVPFMISTEAYLTLGAYFGNRHIQSTNMPGFGDESLYSAGLHLGFGVFLDDNMLLEGRVSPGTWSDWDGTLHHQDYDYPARVLLTVRSTEEFFFKGGARYNEIFEEANFLPYLGMSWDYEGFRLDVLLPEYIEASYWTSDAFGVLGGVEIRGAEYRVRSSMATGDQQADARVQEVLVYGGANWRFNDFTSMRARVGVATAGDYKLDDGLASSPRVDGTLEATLFVDVSMGIDW